MDDKKFWKLVEQMDWDHKKVLDFPEEDQLDFCKTFEAKQAAMHNHQTYCCDSAMDGSWSAVAWGKKHYEKLWDGIKRDPDSGSDQLCNYSHREGKSGEMLGYRIRGYIDLMQEPKDSFALETPKRFAELLDLPVETIKPLWDKTIRPKVETVESYLAFREPEARRMCMTPRSRKVNEEEVQKILEQWRETWNERYAEHVGAEAEVKTYKVRTVFLVEEDVQIEARSQYEAIRLAEEWAEKNAGDREVMTPHSMYHCEGWKVEQSSPA
jgi:hypothetical protein